MNIGDDSIPSDGVGIFFPPPPPPSRLLPRWRRNWRQMPVPPPLRLYKPAASRDHGSSPQHRITSLLLLLHQRHASSIDLSASSTSKHVGQVRQLRLRGQDQLHEGEQLWCRHSRHREPRGAP